MSSSSVFEDFKFSPSLFPFKDSVLTLTEWLKEGKPVNPGDLTDIETFLEDFDRLRAQTKDEDWKTTSEVFFTSLSNLNGMVRILHKNVQTSNKKI